MIDPDQMYDAVSEAVECKARNVFDTFTDEELEAYVAWAGVPDAGSGDQWLLAIVNEIVADRKAEAFA